MKKEHKILNPIQSFLQNQSLGGIILIIFALAALIISNTSWSEYYFSFLNTHISLHISTVISLDKPILLWVNDAAMALFFLMVGLEIKRELLAGELNSREKFTLPLFAAIGGMLLPALIYFLININTPGASGWGIPMATDIAFAVGLLIILGKRIPLSLKVFLVALAIVDDIGAILVISIFYTSQITMEWLVISAGITLLLIILNMLKVIKPWIYLLIGFCLWYAVLKSGVHSTIAGVILAFTIPARPKIRPARFLKLLSNKLAEFKTSCKSEIEFLANQDQQETVQQMEISCHRMLSPLLRIEHAIHPLVSFIVLPLFAFCNAGLAITTEWTDNLLSLTSLGIAAGLLIGKPLGIIAFTWVAVKLNWAKLPNDMSMKHIVGVGFLAGIGFTMALFINNLAFANPDIADMNKISIFLSSLLAGILGYLFLRQLSKNQ